MSFLARTIFVPLTFLSLTGMAPPGQGQPGGAPSMLVSMLPFLLILVIFYFLLILPQQRKAKKHQQMLKTLQKGDEVVTASGIHAKVALVTDEPVVSLEVADRVVIRINRDQISEIKSRRADKKAEPEKKK